MSAAPPERRLPLPQQSSTRTPAAGSAIGSLRWFPLSVEHTCPRGKPAKQSELISRGANARIDFWVGTPSRTRISHHAPAATPPPFACAVRGRDREELWISGRAPIGIRCLTRARSCRRRVVCGSILNCTAGRPQLSRTPRTGQISLATDPFSRLSTGGGLHANTDH